jgi:hypothetical protein
VGGVIELIRRLRDTAVVLTQLGDLTVSLSHLVALGKSDRHGDGDHSGRGDGRRRGREASRRQRGSEDVGQSHVRFRLEPEPRSRGAGLGLTSGTGRWARMRLAEREGEDMDDVAELACSPVRTFGEHSHVWAP